MSSSKTVMVTGIGGQDAAYLAQYLLGRGDRVIGTKRPNANSDFWRLKALGIDRDIQYVDMDLTDPHSVTRAVDTCMPEYIYNLAAQSHVGLSYTMPMMTINTNGGGVINLLEAIRGSSAKLYQAGTSEMFGNAPMSPFGYTEETPFVPVSPYAVGKVMASYAIDAYRAAYKVEAKEGILFNHESPLRGDNFVTQKICRGLARWVRTGEGFTLGNIDAFRDWGYAPEFVRGMVDIMEKAPGTRYVLATGLTMSVFNFIRCAAEVVGVDPAVDGDRIVDRKTGRAFCKLEVRDMRPTDVHYLKGNPTKAMVDFGWEAKTKAPELARIMMEAAFGSGK